MIAKTKRNGSRRRLLAAAAAATVGVTALNARGATDQWTGASDANWSTAGNWTGGNAPPVSGDALLYTGSTPNDSTTNDISGLSLSGITFNAGADSYTLGGGNGVALTGAITDNAANLQTINLPLSITGTQSVVVAGGGSLLLGGVVSESAAGSGVLLSGGGTLTYGALNTYSGPTTINGGNLVLAAGADNTSLGGALIFGAGTGSTFTGSLNLSSANLMVGGLTVQTINSTANQITIGAGKTLSVNGAVTIGVANVATTTALNLAGGGTFLATTNNANFIIGPESNTTGNTIVVDMSGLANFSANTGTGQFRIAGGTGNGTGDRVNATVTFANTSNTISAAAFVVGGGANSNNNTLTTLHLGAGTNVINASTFNVSTDKQTSVMDFATGAGSLKIRGSGGTDADRANVTIGSRGVSGSTAATGTVNLTGGHNVDILANTLLIGRNTNSNGGEQGSLSFDAGTIDATTVQMGIRTNGGVTGTLTVSGTGTLKVGTGGFTVTDSGSNAAGAVVNINGGLVDSQSSIVEGVNTTGVSTINLQGGTLNLNGNAIGAASPANINNLNFKSGTLKNVSQINGGANISVAPTASDTFVLDGTNTYTGNTTVAAGTLLLNSINAASQTSVVVTPNNGLKFSPAAGGTFNVGNLGGAGNVALVDNALAPAPITLNLGNNAASSPTYSGALSGGGTLNIIGGTVTLAGANAHTGGTNVTGGTLVLNSTGSLPASGAVVVNSGGKLSGNMGGSNTAGNGTLNSGGTIIAGIGNTTPGVLNLNNLTVNGGTLQFDLGTTTTSSLLNILTGGNAAFTAGSTISIPNSALNVGTYTLVQSPSAISYPGGTPNFTTQFPTDAFTYALNFADPTKILLNVAGQIAHLTWTGGTGAGDQTTWDNSTNTSAQNWKNTDTNTDGVNYADPNAVTFGDIAAGSVSVTLNGAVSPNSVTVNGNTTSYTIQGGGSINGAITTLTKSGSSTLAMLTANSFGGGSTINAGVVQINSATSLGASTGNLALNSGTLEVIAGNTIVSVRNIALGSGSSTIQVDSGSTYSLSGTVSGTGTLNATGAGALALLNSTNTYSGGTVISGGGAVQINGDGSLGNAASSVTINAGTLEALNSITSNRGITLAAASSAIQVDGGGSTFTANGVLSGGGTLNKAGAGTLALTANNTYSGGTVITGGSVAITSDSAGLLNLGPANAIVAGSNNNNVVVSGNGTLAINASMALNPARSIGLAGTGGLSVASGAQVTYGGVITDSNAAGNVTLNVAGTSVSSPTTPGLLYLTGNSTYTGTTNLSGTGTTQLAAGANHLPANTPITLSGASVLVLGDASGPANQTITTLASGGANATPSILGGNAAISTLTVNYGGASANYSRGIGGPGVNQNNVAIVFNGNGILRLNAAGGANADNTYTGGTTILSGTLTAAQTHAFGSTTGLVTVANGTMGIEAGTTVASGVAPYNVAVPDNAFSSINSGRNANGAAFTQTLGNLTIGGGATLNVNQGNFVNSGTASLAFAGTTTLSAVGGATSILSPNSATIALGDVRGAATAGNTDVLQLDGGFAGNTITGTISDGSAGGRLAVVKANNSTWTLSGNNTYSESTAINGGTLAVTSSAALGNVSATNGISFNGGTLQAAGIVNSAARDVSVNPGGATLDSNGNSITLGNVDGAGGTLAKNGAGDLTVTHFRTATVSVTAGRLLVEPSGAAGGVSALSGTSVSAGAQLDITNNHLIDHSTAIGTWNGSNYDGMTGMIASGRNSGAWNGSGVVTSSASGNFTGIGLATAQQVKGLANPTDTSTWAGQTVTGSDTLVMFTYGGDANLDGKINVDDYGRIDFNVNLGTSGWYNGDFNYDGKINVDDYGIIDFNVGIQGAPFFTAGGASLGVSALSGVSAVPEPTTLGSIAAATAALLLARRRRSPSRN